MGLFLLMDKLGVGKHTVCLGNCMILSNKGLFLDLCNLNNK